jgi:hypothetical protein
MEKSIVLLSVYVLFEQAFGTFVNHPYMVMVLLIIIGILKIYLSADDEWGLRQLLYSATCFVCLEMTFTYLGFLLLLYSCLQ